MSAHEEIGQLRDELGAIVDPVVSMLSPDVGAAIEHELQVVPPVVVEQLFAGDRNTCARVMRALWPHGQPEQVGRADWWRTPLGRACARLVDDDGAVTQAVAAAMLGVHRGTVAQMVTRGTLARHPDGGVSRRAVLRRIATNRTGGA